ncbi:hypothetical protein C8Q75DRAFT_309360 [Abortiporus biennis]|nr:hypothetical protein C8Q75DRAFT_309360 [Abortiporus biennis]
MSGGGDISWMKKGLRKRAPGEWFSDPKTTTKVPSTKSAVSSTPTVAKSVTTGGTTSQGDVTAQNEVFKESSNKTVYIFDFRDEGLTTTDAWSLHDNLPPESYIYTTQPPKFSKSTGNLEIDPDGHTECFLYAPTKRFIMAPHGFPERIRRAPKIPYEVQEIPGRGKGLVALQDLEAGDLIIAERPLTVSAQAIKAPPVDSSRINPKYNDIMKQYQDEYHILFQNLADRMEPRQKAEFMGLVNSHEHDGSGPIFGRIRTNSFGVTFKGDSSNELANLCNVVGNIISRANHSCCPNSMFSFDEPSFSIELRAVRKIKKGEEITVAYHAGELASTSER